LVEASVITAAASQAIAVRLENSAWFRLRLERDAALVPMALPPLADTLDYKQLGKSLSQTGSGVRSACSHGRSDSNRSHRVTVEQDEQGGFRVLNGRASFEAGHIPGAGFADRTMLQLEVDGFGCHAPLEIAVIEKHFSSIFFRDRR